MLYRDTTKVVFIERWPMDASGLSYKAYVIMYTVYYRENKVERRYCRDAQQNDTRHITVTIVLPSLTWTQ